MLESDLLNSIGSYVDGRWITESDSECATVRNPADGEMLARVPQIGSGRASAAVQAASNRSATFLSTEERRSWLIRIGAALVARRDELARIITLENGKPIGEAVAEVDYAAGFFRFFADSLSALDPEILPTQSRGCRWQVFRRPIGVAGLITPWNFPLAMLAKKFAPALAAGNAVVVKPAPETPLSAIALFQLVHEAGLPPGTANLLLGSAELIGRVLCEDPLVRLISFTGSTQVGRILAAQCAPGVKRLALELGGNAPFVVFEDADIDHAADQFVANKFRAGGQTCVCANRVLVHADVETRWISALIDRIQRLRLGPGIDPASQIGPLINRKGFDKVVAHLQDALDKGAELVLGGRPERPASDWGCFFPPTMIRNVRGGMKVIEEETFGPLVAVSSFESEAEAVERANGTPYGLAAYVFGGDQVRNARVVARLQFGHVGCNTAAGPTPEAPFGGFKLSGYGREGGIEGLLEFTEIQTVADPA